MSEGNPATDKQKNVLADFGYNPNVTFEEASAIIDKIAANGWQRTTTDGQQQPAATGAPSNRPAGNPCTAKQKACLEKFGLDPHVTFERARVELDKLAANNWQLPSTPAVTQTAPSPPAASQYGDLPSF
jgi:hypothetical protein